MKTRNKYSAPALERGIEALKLLNVEGPLPLEKLSGFSGIPKSSMLRIMQTLEQMGMVQRDPASKRFEATVALVPRKENDRIIRTALLKCMQELSREVSLTVEWYVPHSGRMMLTDRYEPEDKLVNVKAKIGFERLLGSELEAVARVSLASGVKMPEKASFWVHDGNGGKKELEIMEAEKMINESGKKLADMDIGYNPYGVRRYAAPVRKTDGELIGVLALAESYSSENDKHIKQRLETLKKAVSDLEEKIVNYL